MATAAHAQARQTEEAHTASHHDAADAAAQVQARQATTSTAARHAYQGSAEAVNAQQALLKAKADYTSAQTLKRAAAQTLRQSAHATHVAYQALQQAQSLHTTLVQSTENMARAQAAQDFTTAIFSSVLAKHPAPPAPAGPDQPSTQPGASPPALPIPLYQATLIPLPPDEEVEGEQLEDYPDLEDEEGGSTSELRTSAEEGDTGTSQKKVKTAKQQQKPSGTRSGLRPRAPTPNHE